MQGVKVYWVAILFLLAGAILIYLNNKQYGELVSAPSGKESGELNVDSSGAKLGKEFNDKPAKPINNNQGNHQDLISNSAEYRDKVAAKKIELEALMKKFNENVSNPQARDEVRSQIKRAMASYNELILPEAMQKIENTDQKGDN